MSAMRWLLLLPVLMGVSCWAQDEPAQKPVCNAHNRGMLWPPHISGHDRVPVEICSGKLLRYRWRALTVDVSDLVKGAQPEGSRDRSAARAESAGAAPASQKPTPEAEPAAR